MTEVEFMRCLRADATTQLEQVETVGRLLPTAVRAVAMGERLATLRNRIQQYDAALAQGSRFAQL